MSYERLSAYDTHQRNDEDVRTTEARALLSCANRLEAARQDDCSKEDFVDALRHNQELWTLFQACLCEADNPLPKDLKQLLLNISCYIDKATFRAISTDDKSILNGLININRQIAAGLKTAPAKADPAPLSPIAQESAPPMPLVTHA